MYPMFFKHVFHNRPMKDFAQFFYKLSILALKTAVTQVAYCYKKKLCLILELKTRYIHLSAN